MESAFRKMRWKDLNGCASNPIGDNGNALAMDYLVTRIRTEHRRVHRDLLVSAQILVFPTRRFLDPITKPITLKSTKTWRGSQRCCLSYQYMIARAGRHPQFNLRHQLHVESFEWPFKFARERCFTKSSPFHL